MHSRSLDVIWDNRCHETTTQDVLRSSSGLPLEPAGSYIIPTDQSKAGRNRLDYDSTFRVGATDEARLNLASKRALVTQNS